jgi:hypothetical protein
MELAICQYVPLRRCAAHTTIVSVERIGVEVVVVLDFGLGQQLSSSIGFKAAGFDDAGPDSMPDELIRRCQAGGACTDYAHIETVERRAPGNRSSIQDHLCNHLFRHLARADRSGGLRDASKATPLYMRPSSRLTDHPEEA